MALTVKARCTSSELVLRCGSGWAATGWATNSLGRA